MTCAAVGPVAGFHTDLPHSVSVVIPVFRSEATLGELCRRIGEAMRPLDPDYEVLLIDDSGGGGSWEVIRTLAQNDRHVRGLRLARNYGQHNALLAGIRAAEREVIVTLDDDLQSPPEEIPKLLDRLADGYDVVYGLPDIREHSAWRNLGAWAIKLALQSVIGARNARLVSPFRAFRRDLRRGFEHYHGADVSIEVLLSWSASRFTAVTVRHDPRRLGRSGYTLRRLIGLALTMATSFSTVPLRVATLAGFLFTLFGVGILSYVLVRFALSKAPVPGFAFLASIITIFSGTQLFTLGVIGEYLGRIHFRSMARPTYLVSETTSSSSQGRRND